MFNVTHLIETGGLFLLFAIIFGESGMMIGFFFPGDTLLFSAGVLAAGGKLHIASVLLTVAVAAILGDNVGYQIGKSLGPRLFSREDSAIFRKEHITRAHEFFQKYGSRTMLLAHFVPVMRSFAPVVAGAAGMPRRLFVLFDAIGDIVWAFLIVLLGFFLGKRFPGVEKAIEPLLIIIIVIFVSPAVWHIVRNSGARATFRHKRRD